MRNSALLRRACRLLPVLGLAMVLSWTVGCRDPRRAPRLATMPTASAAVSGDDPAEVVRAFLSSCIELARLGVAGMRADENREAYSHAEQVLKGLADREGIAATWKGAWGNASPHAREGRIDSIIKNWPSMVAYYADGIDLASARVSEGGTAWPGVAANSPVADHVAIVHATCPEAARELKNIRAAAAKASDATGKPLRPGTAAFDAWVRRESARLGLPPSADCQIIVGLQRTAQGFRVVSLSLANTVLQPTTQSSPSSRQSS